MFKNEWMAVFFGLCVLTLVGCDATIDRFPNNDLYSLVAAKRESSDEPLHLINVQSTLEESLGTPDEPRVPESLSSLLDVEILKRAAGPQSSDQDGVHFGLYREHCATCHGVDGGGKGPAAALLTPYPRDFRPGVFKFKSTGRADKPTHDDLLKLLKRGIPGTAMPSFATVNDGDLESLVQYTIYLSIRGETERKLIDRLMAADLSSDALRDASAQIVREVATNWKDAAIRMVPVPEKIMTARVSANDNAFDWWNNEKLITKGQELFHGPFANCASCHGQGGNGNATTLDFDDWTKEYTTKLGISPSDRAAVTTMKAAGALTPRQSLPRNLQWGVFHGDDSDAALYRRLVVGIAGTPMPGLLLKDKPDGVGVEPADVWAIIAYVRSLGESPLIAGKP